MSDQSLDDILENERADKLQHTLFQEKLPEDNDRPAAPASDVSEKENIPYDHPSLDTDQDSFERYQDG